MGGSAANSPAVQRSLANFMDAAMNGRGESQFQRVNPDDYNTKLSTEDEKKFQTWKQKYAPKDSGYDYDLRGAYKEGLKPDPQTGHWPDTYKKPNHETFSDESKYADYTAGTWTGPNHDIYQSPLPLPLSEAKLPSKFVNSDKGFLYNSLQSLLSANSGGLNSKPALDQYTKQVGEMPDAAIRGAVDALAGIPDLAIAGGKLALQGGFNPRMGQSERVKRFADTTYMPVNPAIQDMLTRAGVAETEGGNNLTRFVSGAMAPYAMGKYAGAVGDAIGAAERRALSNAERGMFAGVGAKTADLEALKVAKKLETDGVDKDAIWSQTGWGRGKDNKWRFEIDDSGATFNDAKNYGEGLGNEYGMLRHPQIETAYPSSDALYFKRQRSDILGSGSYTPGWSGDKNYAGLAPEISITAPDAISAKPTALHEVQHYLQEKEKFDLGSSPNSFSSGPMFDKNIGNMTSDFSKVMTGGYGGKPAEWMGSIKDADRNILKPIAKKYGFNKVDDALEAISKADIDRTPFGQYRRVAGEVEARNVETRMNMTPAERLLTPPWKTEDVARDKQIVRFGGGKSMSLPTDDLPMDEASRMARADEMLPDSVFHGTRKKFKAFDPNKVDIGVHVGTAAQAENRLKSTADPYKLGRSNTVGGGGNIMPLRTKFGKSLEMDDVGNWNDSEVLSRELSKKGFTVDDIIGDASEVKRQYESGDDWLASPENRQNLDELNRILREKGYDSIKYKNQVENEYGELTNVLPHIKKEKDKIAAEISMLEKAAHDRMPKPPTAGSVNADAELDAFLNAKRSDYLQPHETKKIDELVAKSRALSNDPKSYDDPYSHIILDTSKLRSRFAKFDPSKRDSSDLLAAGLPLSAFVGEKDDTPYDRLKRKFKGAK